LARNVGKKRWQDKPDIGASLISIAPLPLPVMIAGVVRNEASMRYLLAVLTLISTAAITSGVRADDCKPVADALSRTAIVPNHVLVVSRSLGKIEAVHLENAYYETFQGVWKQLPYNDAEQAARMSGAFQGKKADCVLRGAETIGDRAVQHYGATEHLRSGEALHDFWIATDNGQLLKSFTTFTSDEVTMSYDYTDIKAPL
jgi:hypothetical protein